VLTDGRSADLETLGFHPPIGDAVTKKLNYIGQTRCRSLECISDGSVISRYNVRRLIVTPACIQVGPGRASVVDGDFISPSRSIGGRPHKAIMRGRHRPLWTGRRSLRRRAVRAAAAPSLMACFAGRPDVVCTTWPNAFRLRRLGPARKPIGKYETPGCESIGQWRQHHVQQPTPVGCGPFNSHHRFQSNRALLSLSASQPVAHSLL